MGKWVAALAVLSVIVWYVGWTVASQERDDFVEQRSDAAIENIGRGPTAQGAEPLPDGTLMEEHPFWWAVILAVIVAVVGAFIILLAVIASNAKRRR